MRLANKILGFLILNMVSLSSYGQMQEYLYKREIKDVSEQWHKIILPDDIYGKLTQDLSDIRIFGITNNKDTIEVPYLIQSSEGKTSNKEIAFKLLNASHNSKGYYYTFEIPTQDTINRIKLNFKQQNFDWPVTLEGSEDRLTWYTVAKDYRIISIKNDWTDFKFTQLVFPVSQYRFFRLLVSSKEKPELIAANIMHDEITPGTFINYPVQRWDEKENGKTKQTEIDAELSYPGRISNLRIGIADSFDYYRPVTAYYVSDSFKDDRGWQYHYATLISGILNSTKKDAFSFNSTTLQKLKIIIENTDNRPLTVSAIEAKGYRYTLVARFTDKATYYLVYGDKQAVRPQYDIERFKDRIPESLSNVKLGNEQAIEKAATVVSVPLFNNKQWLWAVMIVIIVILGWFSFKMMKKE